MEPDLKTDDILPYLKSVGTIPVFKERLMTWNYGFVLIDPMLGLTPVIELEMLKRAIKMKSEKAAGKSGMVAEMLQASRDVDVRMVIALANAIVREETVRRDWKENVIINCYKGKGNATERGNYKGLNLLNQVMKAVKRVFEKLVRESVKIDRMQFGFMPRKGTTEAIFLVRQLQEKYLGKQRKLYFEFVDL